jgi:hypothetical protein
MKGQICPWHHESEIPDLELPPIAWRVAMAISGVSVAASAAASAQQTAQTSPHKHGHHRATSMTDVDAQGSSIATAPSPTGKIGSKIDITV